MSDTYFRMDDTKVESLTDLIKSYGDDARNAINDVLHGTGASGIEKEIMNIMPVSGRSFKGHSSSARSAMPGAFSQTDGNLSITISAKGAYGYLYFPDDGSSTVKHAGNQHFMQHGSENATEKIIETVTQKLVNKFEGD